MLKPPGAMATLEVAFHALAAVMRDQQRGETDEDGGAGDPGEHANRK